MKLNKPKFWSTKNNFISFLLLPITLIVFFYIFLRKRFAKPIKFNIPIICVGNIYIGGTGKTPIAILLANEIKKLGRNPSIIRKFYKDHSDEHNLIKENFGHLILGKNRSECIRQAEKENYDIAILDDGLQDYKIKKDINIVCFNQKQLIGNGLILPAGPLRENLSSLKNANIILINGKKDSSFEKKILQINKNLEIFYSYYKPINLEQFKNKKLLALAGIGNPENFFQLIEDNGLNVVKKLVFPDHYHFTKTEIEGISKEAKVNNYKIIMTEKDFFKIKKFNLIDIEYLKVVLEINKKNNLINIINKSI